MAAQGGRSGSRLIMKLPLATVIDTDALLQTIAASFVVGLGVAFAYSLAIYATARYIDLRRDERAGAAAVAAGAAAVVFVICGTAIALGIIVMTSK